MWKSAILIENKLNKNSELVKNVIKLLGKLLKRKQENEYLNQYVKIILEYSKPDQKDFLRLSVITSIQNCFQEISQRIDFQMSVSINLVFLRLLDDQLPIIRNKMTQLVSEFVKQPSQIQMIQELNPSICQQYLFEKLVDDFLSNSVMNSIESNQKLIFGFLLSQLFEQEQFHIKKTNNLDKVSIFQHDKPNNYQDDMSIKKTSFLQICKLMQIQMQWLSIEYLYEQCKHQLFMNFNQPQSIVDYPNGVLDRDEYDFECILNHLYYHLLIQKIEKSQNQNRNQLFDLIAFSNKGYELHLKQIITQFR